MMDIIQLFAFIFACVSGVALLLLTLELFQAPDGRALMLVRIGLIMVISSLIMGVILPIVLPVQVSGDNFRYAHAFYFIKALLEILFSAAVILIGFGLRSHFRDFRLNKSSQPTQGK